MKEGNTFVGGGAEWGHREDTFEEINCWGGSRKEKEQKGNGTGWDGPGGRRPVKYRLHFPVRFKLI